jgi:hypothetical protein
LFELLLLNGSQTSDRQLLTPCYPCTPLAGLHAAHFHAALLLLPHLLCCCCQGALLTCSSAATTQLPMHQMLLSIESACRTFPCHQGLYSRQEMMLLLRCCCQGALLGNPKVPQFLLTLLLVVVVAILQ